MDIQIPAETKNFLIAFMSQQVHVPTKPPIQQISGISTGTKQSRNEADHSPPPTAELMTMWSYTSTPKRHFQRAVVN
jgi:hypothetical protein